MVQDKINKLSAEMEHQAKVIKDFKKRERSQEEALTIIKDQMEAQNSKFRNDI